MGKFVPHKRNTDRIDSPPDLVPTLHQLAKALGVSADAMTHWRRRGIAVGGPSGWSITGTYLAARRAKLKPKLPADARLVELIDESVKTEKNAAGIKDALEFELPGKSAYDPLFRNQPIRMRTDAILREQLIGEEQKNEKLRIAIDQERAKLVTQEEATAAAAAVRDGFVALLKQVWPRLDNKLPEDIAASARQKIATALQDTQQELLAELCL